MIRIENLNFSYKDNSEENEMKYTSALNNLNLAIKEGEFVAILGHNGSGKSTLAKLLNGQIFPTKGDILICGMNTKDEKKIWDIREKCSMVFQNPDNQMVATTVENEVAFGPENLQVKNPELRQRVDEAIKLVGMENYKKRSPSALSGGQKQRVSIAGVIAMLSDCIIFDEPTAMLDPQGRNDVMDIIQTLNKKYKKTVVHITHYMEEAALADRIIVLNKGEKALEGSAREVFSKVKEMKDLGLTVPQVTEIAYEREEENYALKNIKLEISKHEIIGLIGQTGSGKSTLVQLLNGLLIPTNGDVFVDGVNTKDKKTRRDIRFKVGLVFQYPENQLFEETVAKDIAFGPKNMGLDDEEIQKRVRNSMEAVGLDYEKIGEKSPFELSGGQQRRVAVCGIISMNPKVLVLDELTAGLDPRGRDKIFGEILKLYDNDPELTIILVSHSMEDVAKYVDRVIVMNKGEVFSDKSTYDTFTKTDLLSIGLDIPQVTKFMKALTEKGEDVRDDIYTVEDAVVELKKYLEAKNE